MTQTTLLAPGVQLHVLLCRNFKHGCLSLQFIQPLSPETSAMNALLPTVLLRGCRGAEDLRAITARLDALYGAGMSTLVRRVGDIQTTGLYCSFLEDRFVNEPLLGQMVDFLSQVLLEPLTENSGFREDFVESEKKNLIATIEAELNDKRSYATTQMIRSMCAQDSFRLPRLGTVEEVAAITPQGLYQQYQKLLSSAPVHIFYVGAAPIETVARLLRPLFSRRQTVGPLPSQTHFHPQLPPQTIKEQMDVVQGKLCMGFTTPIEQDNPLFVPMQLLVSIYGGSTAVNKLFMNVREKLHLCYDIGAGYYGTKGILVVSAGTDTSQMDSARQEILRQLQLCREGSITEKELSAAKQALCAGLRAVTDSVGAMESYYATASLSGLNMTPAEYRAAIENVTLEQVVEAAKTITLHTTYYLEGKV